MKKIYFTLFLLIFSSPVFSQKKSKLDQPPAIQAIKQVIEDYDQGWDAKDLELVLKGYAEEVDWTNAFGDRMQGKKALKSLLETIFSLDFVMSGQNNYQAPDITFPGSDIALVRSTNIRSGQKWPDGSPMKDRVINHLRVFKKMNGQWLIIHHMISQAQEKQKR
ncbi:MAG: SgcJ/EcaC family oxidoreductase [Bacteroidota bacterium]